MTDGARFRLAIVSELWPRAEFATRTCERPRFAIDRASFDEVMAAVAPELEVRLDGAAVRLRFTKMRDFRPELLATSIGLPAQSNAPESAGGLLDELLDAHEAKAAGLVGSESPVAKLAAHDEVRRLERAWRGLRLVVDRCGPHGRASVEAWVAPADGVVEALARMSNDEAGRPDLVVVDHDVAADPRHLELALRWAAAGEAMATPIVANGTASLVGLDDLAALARSQRRLRSSDDPRAVAVRAAAAREETRWIALALNGVVARPRHTPDQPRGGVSIDERRDLIAGAAIGVAMLAAQEAAESGWAFRLDGVLRELAVRTADDRGQPVAIACEALVRDDVAAEAAAAGLAVLTSAPDKDVAHMPLAPMLHRGRPDAAGASPAAGVSLGDQLFVSRLAHLARQVAAAIPGGTPLANARDVARIIIAEALSGRTRAPNVDVDAAIDPPRLVLRVFPRGLRAGAPEPIEIDVPLI